MDLITNFPTDIIVLAAWTGNISEWLRLEVELRGFISLFQVTF